MAGTVMIAGRWAELNHGKHEQEKGGGGEGMKEFSEYINKIQGNIYKLPAIETMNKIQGIIYKSPIVEAFNKTQGIYNSPAIEALNRLSQNFNKFNVIPDVMKTIAKFNNYYNDILKIIPSPYLDTFGNDNKLYIKSIENKSISVPAENQEDIISINKMIPNISLDEITNFINYIATHPMLAYRHKVGKDIFDYIETQGQENISGVTVYRVRKALRNHSIPFTQNEMFEPEFTKPSQNRFSNLGINSLYLSQDLEIAKKETGVVRRSRYTYIKLNIKNPLKLLNVCDKNIPLFSSCHKMTKSKNNLKTEYLISNFVADCANELKFDGIIYYSVFDHSKKNYVLFGVGQRDFTDIELKGENY